VDLSLLRALLPIGYELWAVLCFHAGPLYLCPDARVHALPRIRDMYRMGMGSLDRLRAHPAPGPPHLEPRPGPFQLLCGRYWTKPIFTVCPKALQAIHTYLKCKSTYLIYLIQILLPVLSHMSVSRETCRGIS